ncbi:hypothetical protein PISMIDRAFT_13075 [Pisolithus microcarpus 441]|uniref:Uncharacterized protein n=1 Tax=Pisolithus microcarpus 441 TaxID=765257 RepID=A0A0C9Z237_9AGAM|nr:hypothetical protein PISMIDRAFT_13075 [Pisolithus microcarpus 441]
MTVMERHVLEVLRDPVLNDSVNELTDDDYETDGYGAMVLDGMEQLDVSHAGSEFQELTSELLGDFWKSTSQEVRAKHPDYPLVHHGLILCSPITLKVAVTVSTLNLYHTACQHCPHLSIQAYVKSLCDMHGVPFYNHRSHQFSIVLDVYLQILALISNLDKPAMRFKMLFAQDGNDSLKRVVTRVLDGNLDDTDQLATSVPTLEHAFHHEQYLTCKFIEKFASDRQTGHSIVDEHGDGNLCVECWKNMKDSVTQKMWNVFDETGAFIAVCQHGFCLVIADMVQSSKQSKYALMTTPASSILGERARSLNYTSLVNAFHGHAHNRLCQLDNLMTYVEGLRLEDLEGCEQAFSKSNALAPSTCYASIFHRRQAITCYFEHNDEMEVYANLMKFLLNNYKQALDLLSNSCATLERLMCELGVSDPTIFRQWLDEEHVYLKSLLWEPAEETLQMEYWQRLVNLAASRQDLETILSTWTVVTAQNVAPIWSDSSATRKRETMCCHAQENYEKDLKAVQELEGHLGITRRWVPEDEEWQAAARLVANRKYQHALDNVEQLVVSQIFELSKMNQSGTGYKLRKHIGKALQTRLAAIRATLTQYNTAAKALGYEDQYLQACEALYQDANPTLAYQISRYHTIHSQFTPLHLCSLEKISRLSGFSGTLAPGISVSHGLGDSAGVPQRVCMDAIFSSSPVAADDGEDDANEDADEDHATTLEEQCEALQNILSVTMDP